MKGLPISSKAKISIKKLHDWKNEVIGNLSERKNQTLEDIKKIVVKAEVGSLVEEECDRRKSL